MLTDKDKEAIAHIASVSKEPHAEMRAEQLITGAKVEWKPCDDSSEWETTDHPVWGLGNEYRLVYQKIKPAYRVYRVKAHGSTYTRDSIDGIRDNSLTDKSEWISDWIEYDEPKKWPTPLVERIAAIDITAAEWIVEHWDDLVAEKYTRGSSNIKNDYLMHAFAWDMTPQGQGYWESINDRM